MREKNMSYYKSFHRVSMSIDQGDIG